MSLASNHISFSLVGLYLGLFWARLDLKDLARNELHYPHSVLRTVC